MLGYELGRSGEKWREVGAKWKPMLLTGTYFRALDEKQRLAIPKPLREAMGHTGDSVFFLAPGTDGSLAFYTEHAFMELAGQLDQSSPNSEDVRAFSRLFFSQAQRAEVDRQGRLRIPVELARLARLGKELALIGVRTHIEIWNRQEWEDYLTRQQGRFDAIAETAFDRSRTFAAASRKNSPAAPEATAALPRSPR